MNKLDEHLAYIAHYERYAEEKDYLIQNLNRRLYYLNGPESDNHSNFFFLKRSIGLASHLSLEGANEAKNIAELFTLGRVVGTYHDYDSYLEVTKERRPLTREEKILYLIGLYDIYGEEDRKRLTTIMFLEDHDYLETKRLVEELVISSNKKIQEERLNGLDYINTFNDRIIIPTKNKSIGIYQI